MGVYRCAETGGGGGGGGEYFTVGNNAMYNSIQGG